MKIFFMINVPTLILHYQSNFFYYIWWLKLKKKGLELVFFFTEGINTTNAYAHIYALKLLVFTIGRST